ncbi:MFS transporter [Hamadaea tsunoensis]|uniref:MFS transporter n=1 Tax=Hamadaea tsunoensis TaxID=53368 RepID=UPI0009FC2537|nr:MFS transporter [Hamadaea tsunoensis]
MAFIRTHTAFRRLWSARVVSFMGDSIGLVALILYVADRSGTGLAVALLMLAGDVAPQLLSPFAGAVADRFDLRRVMVACELGQAAVMLVIAVLLPPLPLLIVLVAARSTLAVIFQPASRSAIPAFVASDDLPRANAALGAGTHGLDVLGPVLAAGLLPFLGVRGLLLVDGFSFLVSAALLVRLPALPPARIAPPSMFADARDGLAYLWSHRVLRVIVVGFCLVVAFNGVDDVALVFLAKGPLHGGDSAASILYAGVGAGLLIGFALLSRYGNRFSPLALIPVGYAVSSLGNLLTGVAASVLIAFAMQTVRGLGLSANDTGHDTLIQRTVPAGLQGRVFSNLYGAIGLAGGLSYVLGGFLIDLTSPRVTLVVAGCGGLAVAAIVARRLRRVGEPPAAGGETANVT